MAIFDIVPGLKFISRQEWTPSSTLPRLGHMVERKKRTHAIIHHTVTPDVDASPHIWENDDEIFKLMRRLQVGRPDLGLDVPYNFVAFLHDSNGLYICEGRGEDRTGAHTKGHNTKGIAVSFAGNFDVGDSSTLNLKGRMELLSAFLRWLRTDASHPDYGTYEPMNNLGSNRPHNREVWFHRDFKATACPGSRLLGPLAEVKFL